MKKMPALRCAFILLSVAFSINGASADDSSQSFRLPATASPKSYDLFIEPNLLKKSFRGAEKISLVIQKPTNEVVINSAEIAIQQASIKDTRGKATELRIGLEPSFERLHLQAPKLMQPGEYTLSLKFTGKLNDQLRGFYSSSFKDSKGKKHLIATTQMEPTDARRMFPCFDEPVYKAVFRLRASVPKDLAAISNSPIASQTVDKNNGNKIVQFAPTPMMSTYLLALIVGPFRPTPALSSDGVPIQVWSVSDRVEMGYYAQKTAVGLLKFYNQYFGTAYPAKKLDLIAIPDFEAGAMENLGAITFRENYLLIDAKTASTSARMHVASIVAHEMAHMWFGDLVTMKWWDDLWLNEAFATWMSVKGCEHLKPEWNVWDGFAEDRVGAMGTDALANARTIQASVNDPAQALEMFDDITYEKGASILRMLECFVGKDKFQKGIAGYIAAHKYSNATTVDLWDAIAGATSLDIPAIMNHWVHQAGFPLIKIESGKDGALSLSQERYLAVPPEDKSKALVMWQVPLVFRQLDTNSEEKTLMRDRTISYGGIGQGIQPPADKPFVVKPFIANAFSNGYYRVQYTKQQLKEIAAAIQIDSVKVAERLNILTDQWALAFSGRVPVSEFLDLAKAYKKETDPAVLSQLTGILQKLDYFIDAANAPAYQRAVREQLNYQKTFFGWNAAADDSDLKKLARADVLTTLGTIGADPEVTAKAKALFEKYRKDPKSVDPDLVTTITQIVAYNGDRAEYDQITALWQHATTPEVEKRNLMALAVFRQPALTQTILDLSLTEKVRTQDAPWLVSSCLRQKYSQQQTWSFVQSHWKQISHRFVEPTLPKLITAASTMRTEKDEDELRNFFTEHPIKAGRRRAAETLERVQANVLFQNNSAQSLNDCIKAAND